MSDYSSQSARISRADSIAPHTLHTDEQESERAATSCFTFTNVMIALPSILTPVLFGYQIGVVGVYSTMYTMATDCRLYQSEKSCSTLSAASCQWVSDEKGSGLCEWSDRTTCNVVYGANEALCKSDSHCAWDYHVGICSNQVGYTSMQKGLFGASMIIGSMVGSLGAGFALPKLNFPRCYLIIGAIATVACALTHVATGVFVYWLLFASRIVLGLGMGAQTVVSPAYVAHFAPQNYRKLMGCLFQVSCSMGGFVSAAVGIALGNTIDYGSSAGNAHVMARMQGFIAPTTLMSVMTALLFFVTKSSPQFSVQKPNSDEPAMDESLPATTALSSTRVPKDSPQETSTENLADEHTSDQDIRPSASARDKCSLYHKVFLFFTGFVLACSMQLTGMMAMMSFAPSIMSVLGLDPLVGNLIIMGWNGVIVFGSLPLSRFFSPKTLFVCSCFIAAGMCVFFCGVPVYPGVTPQPTVMYGIAITGIIMFITCFNLGFGTNFFILANDIFPTSLKPLGSSFIITSEFLLSVFTNICYPIITEKISGGPSGNPNKGQAVVFIFFGCVGFITATFELFFMHPWENKSMELHAESRGDVGSDHEGGYELDAGNSGDRGNALSQEESF